MADHSDCTLAEALGSCHIDRQVEGSWYRIHVGFGKKDRILLVVLCSGATISCKSPVTFTVGLSVLGGMPKEGGPC